MTRGEYRFEIYVHVRRPGPGATTSASRQDSRWLPSWRWTAEMTDTLR